MKILDIKNGFLFENSKEVEDGIKIGGYFRKWGRPNFNGYKYTENSFDNFINEYFVKNELNVPVNLMHGGSFVELAGKVTNMVKNEVGIWIDVLISKHSVYFENTKGLIKDKILQGFSDEGAALDYEYIKNDAGDLECIEIKEAILNKISLVDLPAEATAAINFKNATNFQGFGIKKKKEDEEVKNKVLPFLKCE